MLVCGFVNAIIATRTHCVSGSPLAIAYTQFVSRVKDVIICTSRFAQRTVPY
jgi:hypothetical protein